MTPDEMVNPDAAVPDGDYYVTVRDAGRTGFLLGPYSDLRDALANRQRAINLACDANADAPWYLYGTARVPQLGKPALRTVFGA